MNVNECPILVSSSDAYDDIWQAFFYIFKREWPDYNGQIILNTDLRDFSFPGLNIRCSRACHDGQHPFGTSLKRSLDMLPGDCFLMMMIDYFLEGAVEVARLQRYYDAFCNGSASALFLAHQDVPATPVAGQIDIEEMDIPSVRGFATQAIFSFQTAFWRKSDMCKFVADWEDPWFAEYYGCQRARILNPCFWKLTNTTTLPIPYDRSGVLHGGGKWLTRSIEKIDFTGVPIDLERSKGVRGIYKECAHPYLSRLPRELKLLPVRLLTWLRSSRQIHVMRANQRKSAG